MIKRGSEIIGLPVICLDENYKSMEIKDIVYDPISYELIALVIEEGKYFHEKKIVRIENIKNIEEEAVTVYTKAYIEKVQINPTLHSMTCGLLGLDILTQEGKDVGTIQDILIDVSIGKLVGIVITEGIFDDLMGGRPILPIDENFNLNKDNLVISNSMSQSIIHNTGGLKRIISLE